MNSIGAALAGAMGMIGVDADNMDEGDYIGATGLVICGKCHTPKQFRLPVMQGIMAIRSGEIVSAACDCQREAFADEYRQRINNENVRRMADLRRASLMDSKFYEATFSEFKTTRHNARQKRVCQRYAERFDDMLAKNQGLVLMGAAGTGKTFAAACIANNLLDKQVPLVMTSFVKLVATVYDGGEREQDVIDRINAASLLIIDDLGAERGTGYAIERVYNIIDSRYRACKPMILTTNLCMAQMQNEPDIRRKRIYDRVFETCYPLEFKGPSWRIAEASRRFRETEQILDTEDMDQ